jgi:probable F420-dependent oxidoreductase
MAGERGYGLTLPVPGMALAAHASWLRTVADAGYTDVWAGEAMVADAFALLAVATVVAPELNVGTAVVPAFTRAPGLLAVSAATLATLAPGRCTIGVGASSATVVQRWGGVPYVQPYQRTRDVLRFLRAALAGQRVTAEYETFAVEGYRLPSPPAVPPRLLAAALRPAMLGLAAREADGAVLTWVSPADVRRMTALLRPGQSAVVWVSVCPSTDAERVRDAMRPLVAEYLTVPGYAASQEWLGRAGVLRPVWDAWADGRRRDAVAAVPDALIDEFVVHGSPQRCRDRLEQYYAAGATSLALSLVTGDMTGGDPVTAVAALAR